MSWVRKIFGGGRGLGIPSDAEPAVCAESVRNAAFESTESEDDYRRRMALIHEALNDEGMERILSEKMLRPVRVPVVDKSSGQFVFLTDEAGEFVLDEAGKKQHLFIERTEINDFYAAIYNMKSQVNRLSFINAQDAKILYWYAEDIVSDIMMSSPRSQLNSGEIAYVKSWLNNIHILLMDATGGRKLRELLTTRSEKAHAVGVGRLDVNDGKEKKVF